MDEKDGVLISGYVRNCCSLIRNRGKSRLELTAEDADASKRQRQRRFDDTKGTKEMQCGVIFFIKKIVFYKMWCNFIP